MSDSDAARAAAVQLVAAEFAQLRNEIVARSRAQQLLLNLNLTATAAVVTLAAVYDANRLVLLLIPFLSCALGFLYLDHAFGIRNLGQYIAGDLRSTAVRLSGCPEALAWEEWNTGHEKAYIVRVVWACATFLVFGGSAVVSLILVALPVLDAWSQIWPPVIWLFSAVLAVAFVLVWIQTIWKAYTW